ncbi:MAG: signal peptidase I [Chloroflexota bacterium]
MKKVINWTITSVLGLVLLGLAVIYFMPGYNLYLVRSESMKPAINMGDLIITGPMGGPINGEIKPGTVVTYERNDELITHRVASVDGKTVVTQGDAVEDPDPWQVTLADVRGVYLFKIPYVGYGLRFIQTKSGWFISIIIPAVVLIGWLIWDILKETFKNELKTTNKGEVKIIVKK